MDTGQATKALPAAEPAEEPATPGCDPRDPTLVADIRPCGQALIPIALRLMAIVAIAVFAASTAEVWLTNGSAPSVLAHIAVWSAFAIVCYAAVVKPFWAWSRSALTIRTDRLELRSARKRDQWIIPLVRIRDVTVDQSLFQRIGGYGTLIVHTDFAALPARARGVSRVSRVSREISELRTEAWQRQWTNQQPQSQPLSTDFPAAS